MNKRRFSRLLVMSLCITLCFSMFFPSAEAASKKKTKTIKTYTDVVKHGNTVYCMVRVNGILCRIYKVNIKTGKKKCIANYLGRATGMQYHKGYLYFSQADGDLRLSSFCRVKPGKKVQYLATAYMGGSDGSASAFIKNNTIYYISAKYSESSPDGVSRSYKKMRLNGKKKTRVKKFKVKLKAAASNAKGYKLIYIGVNRQNYNDYYKKYEYQYYKCYLAKPDGSKVYLTKVEYPKDFDNVIN